jgi:hypothetical protein
MTNTTGSTVVCFVIIYARCARQYFQRVVGPLDDPPTQSFGSEYQTLGRAITHIRDF